MSAVDRVLFEAELLITGYTKRECYDCAGQGEYYMTNSFDQKKLHACSRCHGGGYIWYNKKGIQVDIDAG